MRYFSWQFKKTLISMESVAVFVFVLGCYFFFGSSGGYLGGAFLSGFLMASYENILVIIFPMLVCLPVAIHFVTEYESGYFNLVLSKMSMWRYAALKMLMNGLAGGLVISLPALFYLGSLLAEKGITVGPSEESAWHVSLYPALYENHPLAYASMIICFIFLSGAAFATLGLGVAATLKKKYLVILAPQVYYIGIAALSQNIDRFRYLDPTTMYILDNGPSPNPLVSFLYAVLIFLMGAIMFVLGVRRNVE